MKHLVIAALLFASAPSFAQSLQSGPTTAAAIGAVSTTDTRLPQTPGAGQPDSTSALQNAVSLAGASGTTRINTGNYTLTNTIYTPPGGTWTFENGAVLSGGAIIGLNDEAAQNGSGFTIARNIQNGSNVLFVSGSSGLTNSTTSYEKEGVYINVATSDPSNDSNDLYLDMVALQSNAEISGTNQAGRIWSIDTSANVPTGTDGYALLFEGGVGNNGTYQANYGGFNSGGFSNAKLGLHIGCSGPVDCTAGEVITGFGAHWHYGSLIRQVGIRSDGDALAYQSTGGSILAGIDYSGNLFGNSVAVGSGSISGGLISGSSLNISGGGAFNGNTTIVGNFTVNGTSSFGTSSAGIFSAAKMIVGNSGETVSGVFQAFANLNGNTYGAGGSGVYAGANCSNGGNEGCIVGGGGGLSLYAAQSNSTVPSYVPPIRINTTNITLNQQIILSQYTVSSLPIGQIGGYVYVTDATSCVFGSTPIGGGSTKCPLFYNGSAWVGG